MGRGITPTTALWLSVREDIHKGEQALGNYDYDSRLGTCREEYIPLWMYIKASRLFSVFRAKN